MKIIYYRESLIQSVLADATTFGFLVGSIWFNYHFVGFSRFLNGVILIMLLISLAGKGANKKQTFTDKQALLNYLTQKEEEE